MAVVTHLRGRGGGGGEGGGDRGYEEVGKEREREEMRGWKFKK